MADEINYYEVHARYVTMKAGAGLIFDRNTKNGTTHTGKALTYTGEGTVDLTTANSEIAGKLIKIEPDGVVTMQDQGYGDLPSDGTTILYGNNVGGLVGGVTAGSVKTATVAPTAGASRSAFAVKSDGVGQIIAKLN